VPCLLRTRTTPKRRRRSPFSRRPAHAIIICARTLPEQKTTKGLPFAVAGVGDLLALFRCVSCRYRFATDAMKPALMGAIGRVYTTCEVRFVCCVCCVCM
jgi:hypothetical protein